MAFTRKCDKCQRFSNTLRSHPEKLTSMVSPWPFAVLGIYLISPLPIVWPAFKYAVVAIDYFTKWAKANLLTTISSRKVQDFVWEAVICQYSLPQEIVSDKGTQVDSKEFEEFYHELSFKKSFSLVDHPQTNDQVEAVNKIIKHNLKIRLEEHKGVWPDECPKVLWAYRMTYKTSTRETPFSLAHRIEVMILVEVSIPSLWHETYDLQENHALQCYELDLLEEKRDPAALRITSYKRRSERYFNSKVKERRFKEGDLVLRMVLPNTKEVKAGVLRSNWKGPYIIPEVIQPGTYKLQLIDGKLVPQSWNAEHLRPYDQ